MLYSHIKEITPKGRFVTPFIARMNYSLFLERMSEKNLRETNLGRKITRVNTIKNGKTVKPLRKHQDVELLVGPPSGAIGK